MTRRGSLAYYLAAWVCGCFFMGTLIWLAILVESDRSLRSAEGFFIIVFFSLICGATTSLLVGFILRCAAVLMNWRHSWQWLLGGAVVAPLLIALLGAISSPGTRQGGWHSWMQLLFFGSYFVHAAKTWVALLPCPAGAATAWVLFRIDRAFGRPSSETTP